MAQLTRDAFNTKIIGLFPNNTAREITEERLREILTDVKDSFINISDDDISGLQYQGVWNASTNTPTIPTASALNRSHYYKVSVAGSTNINGITSWGVNDVLLSTGAEWIRFNNSVVEIPEISLLEIENEATSNSTSYVSGRRFWQGMARFIALAWTFAQKITFSLSPRFNSVGTNQYLKTDTNKDLVGTSTIPYSDITGAPSVAQETSQIVIEDSLTVESNTYVSPRRFWQGITRFLQLASTFAQKITFTSAPRFNSTLGNQYLKVDANKDLTAVSQIPYVDISGAPIPISETAQATIENEASSESTNYTSVRRFWQGIARLLAKTNVFSGVNTFNNTTFFSRISLTSSPTVTLNTNQNDYNVSALNTYIRINATADFNITGLQGDGNDGQVRYIENVGAGAITFLQDNSGSSTTNRLRFSGDSIILKLNEVVMCVYDFSVNRWRLAKVSTSEITLATIQNSATTSTDNVTGRRFWSGLAQFTSSAWTWTQKQTFNTFAPRFGTVSANRHLKVDANSDLIGITTNDLKTELGISTDLGTKVNKSGDTMTGLLKYDNTVTFDGQGKSIPDYETVQGEVQVQIQASALVPTDKNVANGVAGLDANARILWAQMAIPQQTSYASWNKRFDKNYVITDTQSGATLALDATGAVEGSKVVIRYNGAQVPTITGFTIEAVGTGQELISKAYDLILTYENGVLKKEIRKVNEAPTASVWIQYDALTVGNQLRLQYSYQDAEGDLPNISAFEYRWLRNGTPIGGATASTYTTVSADAGTTVRGEIKVKALTGTQNDAWAGAQVSIT